MNVTEVGAHGLASRKMTEMIWNKARNMCPALRLRNNKTVPVQFFDLGAGDGTAAALCANKIQMFTSNA